MFKLVSDQLWALHCALSSSSVTNANRLHYLQRSPSAINRILRHLHTRQKYHGTEQIRKSESAPTSSQTPKDVARVPAETPLQGRRLARQQRAYPQNAGSRHASNSFTSRRNNRPYCNSHFGNLDPKIRTICEVSACTFEYVTHVISYCLVLGGIMG